MINIEQNKYCVYEHIRKDTNQCFYVGKGTLKRAYNQIRNKHHNRIVKKCGSVRNDEDKESVPYRNWSGISDCKVCNG